MSTFKETFMHRVSTDRKSAAIWIACDVLNEADELVGQLVGALTKCADRAIGLDPFTLEEVLAALARAKELQA